ncbi:hypothetical protein [Bradyrhizobium australiense]|uniref:Uncharacterized protein n=1 Tax=Bradyrhizobium australiense TaxID=2721161 RepID=A0A7Y4GTL2_9BRAD|nr:hypothetical protein [Bradyrhizobium australiense]NOJ41378.1 hypothetical protein [Bradyrhizobium australiense]
MSEPGETLKKARANLVTMRQRWAEVLATPYERGKTEEAVTKLIELQEAIEAIDAAIAEASGKSSSTELRL